MLQHRLPVLTPHPLPCCACAAEFRARLAAGTNLDDLLVEAFAVVREAARRVLGMRHFDCQLVSGGLAVQRCATAVLYSAALIPAAT